MVAPDQGKQRRKKKNRGARGGENRGVKRRLEEVEAELAQSNARLLKVKGKRDADRDELTSTRAKLEKIRSGSPVCKRRGMMDRSLPNRTRLLFVIFTSCVSTYVYNSCSSKEKQQNT